MDPDDHRGDETMVVPIDHVEDCEPIVSPATISGGEQAASSTAPGTVSDVGEGLTIVDDSGREERKENRSGKEAFGLVAAPAEISGGEVRVADVDDGGGFGISEKIGRESCGLVAQAVIPRREMESAVDDGGNEGRISENCDRNAATEMISGGGEVATALDDGGGGKSCESFCDLYKDMAVRVEGYGQVATPVMISGGLEAAAAVDDVGISGKKRGRPRRGQVRAVAVKKVKVVEEEEDVCFICFDGGSLVLCDRRGCPKAYHPACLKQDEAFFQSKAKWTCGWHFCSICQKAAHHMCYTCTYSLCKTCTKDADFLSLRENRGLCAICMRTIMLIERNIPGDKDTVQVDFDDKTSWEYFFKYYWVSLKEKLSLSLDELIQAKSPHKAAELVVPKEQQLDVVCVSADCKSSISNAPSRNLKAADSKKRGIKEQCILPKIKDCQNRGKSISDKSTTLSESPEWATEELLEFVAHMRNGDVSMLSQFDIQGLLLEYIKRNNLRDPRQKSQIICDSRLMNLFGKARVAHFEMLKLLEYHFLMDEDNQKESTLGNIVRTAPNQVEGGGYNESLLKIDKDKKRKARRKGEERGPQTNLDEFAAIDVHNINLIYLRRSLMENLVTANAKFHDKVVGSIVRIRISGADPKQDMYRLVQVIGTCKASAPYKVGGKTVDVMLVILNLHKKETVAIDSISNQEFSEDECGRLRQSIKCGLVKQMTVGLVQEKARALQEVRLNDWLETEMMRLNHLRDRASEKGLKKELRECVEKIELLKTPEERQRRLNEKLQVHADPKMDPKCESDDDAGEVIKHKQAEQLKQKFPGFRELGRDLISIPIKSKQAKFNSDKGPSSRFKEKVYESPERKEIVVSKTPIVSLLPKRNDTAVSETPTVSLSNGSLPSTYKSETEMFWHYRDPNKKIQGPFCLVQLRKWSTTGYFPLDMRVWSMNTDESDSFLLTDVLSGDFLKAVPSLSNTSLPDRLYICEDRHSSSVNPTLVNDGKQSNESSRWNSGTSYGNLSSVGNKLHPHVVHDYQYDNQRFSGQSSVGSFLSVNIVSNNSDSNFSLASVAKSADSSGAHQMNAQNLGIQAPVITDSRTLSNHTSKDHKPSQYCAPVQGLVMEELPSPTPKLKDREEKTDLGIQNLPCAAPMAVDGDVKVDSSFANSPNSMPNARTTNEIAQATESKPPDTCCTSGSSSRTQSGRNMKADVSVQNLQNPSRNTVDGGNIVNLSIRKSSSLAPNPRDRDEKFGAHESKPPLTSLTCDSITSEPSNRYEKGDASIQNRPSLSSKTVDGDGKIDSRVKNLPSSTRDPSDGNDQVRVNQSKPPGTSTFTSTTTKPDVKNERDAEDIQNLSGFSPKTVHEDENFDSTFQNLPSSLPDTRDGNEKIQAESKPSVTGLTSYSPPKPSNRDEKTGIDIQNFSSSSLKTVDENDTVDLAVNDSSSSLLDSTYTNKKVLANEIKSPGTSLSCSSSPPEPSDRYKKSGFVTQNVPSISLKVVDGDEESDFPVQDLPISPLDPTDGNEKVQASECEPPVTSLTSDSTTPEPNERDDEAKNEKVDLIPNTRDENEKVEDYSSTHTKPPEVSNDQLSTAASVIDQFSAPITLDHSPSTSNWGTFLYEPIELTALAEESVSDLWAEVDAMEVQGDVPPPTSGDDFFASISGIGHLFDFAKTDNVSSNEEYSPLPQPTVVSEPLGLSQIDIFDSSRRSDGEALVPDTLRNYAENGINNRISFEMRPTMGGNWGNTNPGFGGLTQEMANVSWGSHPSFVQMNMDVNRNTSFGFMGHERRRDWRSDGGGS